MRIERQRHLGIRSGTITVMFRRWKRSQVLAGNVYRTAAGRVAVDAVDIVEFADITDSDARAAGYDSARSVREDLRGSPEYTVYRLRIRYVDEPDPRDQLAATNDLSLQDVVELRSKLERLDRFGADGPWTEVTLRIIRRRPAVRAADLAAELGCDPVRFKLDVRKLKNLGLTVSLDTGYEISPRGSAYLAGL
jgi:hypothetical protein